MKVTNKSELMKAAWKMFHNTKNNLKTFAEALKIAWTMFKSYKRNETKKAIENSGENAELKKAMNWARVKVSKTFTEWDFEDWKAFAEEHRAEASIWKLAAKYARMQDSEFYSYC